mmetsp:Transcript_17418/g.33065  ORF Transcript_17418/g.33065 Transcript_17418/m.33065 type:complete len:674 (-) Transcript_17418:215-2236(-)
MTTKPEEEEAVEVRVKNAAEAEGGAAADVQVGTSASTSTPAAATTSTEPPRKLGSAKSSGMDASVLRVKNVNFTVGKGDKAKQILQDINVKIKWGHVLALMGPSGAGKTVLVSALTLDALFGRATGTVTLNGVDLTTTMFKQHAYVVVQNDKLWPYLTCRETLTYAGELFDIASGDKQILDEAVSVIIHKLGLDICADVRFSGLSGGQQKRLSLGLALLKSPTLLFLDEPTTGLDAAASENIMQEIVALARAEHLIVICTIHQPSTKVYNGFDQVMILSKGREAFTGPVKEAVPYFESIGHALPLQTNPAEHFLDLVNSDFSDEDQVNKILDTWQERRPDAGASSHHGKKWKTEGGADDDEGQEGVVHLQRAPFVAEMAIMFRRHSTLILRDPILYLGRCVIHFVVNLIFSLVYLNARDFTQDQAVNKVWLGVWLVAVPCNMGVVAVYALNDEFKTITREVKNGMVSPLTYVTAKTLLVLPVMILFALCALTVQWFVILDTPWGSFGFAIIIWAACIFVFESLAEALSVWFDDPILGMLNYMNFWFGSFLFGGFLIPRSDMYYPFEAFYYIMPFSYYLRSMMYNSLSDTTFDTCDDQSASQVCVLEADGDTGVTNPSGKLVLEELSKVLPVVENDDTIVRDIFVLLAFGVAYKVLYIIGVVYKSTRSSQIYPS